MIINKKFNKDKLWFTSDPHYFHGGIIKFCNRPYFDSWEMNEALIGNWNMNIKADDDVFILGDFAFTGNIEKVLDIGYRLNGNKYLILGNHCYQSRLQREIFKKVFVEICDVATINVIDDELEEGSMNIFMSHYPHLYWMRNYIHLHGHIHSGPKSMASELPIFHPMRYDVGVDNNNFKPVSYDDIKTIITKQMLQNKFVK